MNTPSRDPNSRVKLIPRFPRRSAQSPMPTRENSENIENNHHDEASVAPLVTGDSDTLTLGPALDGVICRTAPEVRDQQPPMEQGVEELSLSSCMSENSACSKSETALREWEAPGAQGGSATSGIISPITPSLSVDSVDIPLPSVETYNEFAEGHSPDTASDPASRESDRTSMPESTEPATPSNREVGSPPSLANGLAGLSLSSPTPDRSSLVVVSEDLLVPLGGTDDPVTVRHLLNATPRPSPGPNTSYADETSIRADSAKFSNGEPSQEGASGSSDKAVDLQGQPSLLVPSEESAWEDCDFSENLEGLQAVDEYDVRSVEPLPASPFSNPGFQSSLKCGIDLAKKILDCIDSCELAAKPETQLHRLRQTASSLSAFDYPAKRRIGIVGDSGAGKSSLINSLLHLPDLANRGDQGSAVTSFVTEYRNRKANQTAPFTIKVKCAERSHLRDQINELVYDVRALTDPGILESISDTEFVALERRSAVALSTLESIFPQREESTKAFLSDTSEGSAERIKARLCELTNEIEFPAGAETGEWLETANNALECRQHIMRFMENGFWPLIDKVKVYLSAQVLKTGIILADLPGFRDINLARVKKAETYQHMCDEIFIVANIKRVVSDRSVRDLMTGEFSNPKPNTTVSIICTHADEINIADWTANRNLQRLVDQNRLRAIRHEMRSATLKKQADLLEKAKMEYKYLFVALRNQRIEREVLDKYASLVTGSASLRVFCVGNKDYEGHDIVYQEARIRAINGSGVPELRDFCHSVVAKAQFRASHHFIEMQIQDLIQSLKLWIEAAEDEAGPVVPSDVLPNLQKKLLSFVELFSNSIRRSLTNHILEKFKRGQGSYDQGAVQAGQEWTTWHHASFKAFMRQNGTYCTPAVGSRRMNNELIQHMDQDLSDAWTALAERLEQKAESLQQNVEGQVVSMRHSLRELKAPETLLNSIKLKERDLKYQLQEERSKFVDAYRTIKHNATEDHYNSYILMTMLPIYRSCAMESGPGMKARMFDTMERKLGRRDIFAFIYDQINREMCRVFDESTRKITNIIEDMCADMERQVQLIRGPESEASSVGTASLQRISVTVHEAKEELQSFRSQAAPARREAVKRGWIN